MLARLIGLSVRHARLVVVLSALLLVVAGLRLPQLPVDVFPELNAPTVVVVAESGGLAAEEVELNVVFPLESALNGLPGMRRLRSASSTGLGFIWVEFEWGADIWRARQMVGERIAAVRSSLPPEVDVEMAPMTSITGEIMLVALSSPDSSRSALELRSEAEFVARPRLLAVPGVAQVVAIGGELPQYQIDVRQDRLALHGLSIGDVVEAVRGAHSTASAGYLADVRREELPIRQGARVRSVEDVASTLVTWRDGAPVVVGEVADVRLGAAPRRGVAADRGEPAVILSVQKSPGTNTLAVTRDVEAALDGIERVLPAGVHLNRHVFRAEDFIVRAVRNVMHVLRDAAIVVGIVLVLFLLNARTTLITLAAIPLSLAAAVLALEILGLSINVMTLGGLAVAIGELVDDAIIDVENVWRRLRENGSLPPEARRPGAEIVVEASNEVRSAVVFATAIICLAFVPLLFLEGLEGRFFRPLGLAYIVAILASLLVALTTTPALCRLLLAPRTGRPPRRADSPLVRLLKAAYAPTLRVALRARWLVLGGAAAATAASLSLATTFGTSFLPTFNEGTFTVFLMAPPGTSLAESDRLARGVERRLVEIDGVASVGRRTGRAERDEHAEPVWHSEVDVVTRPGADRAEIRRAIDEVIAAVPGIATMIGQPIEHRLSHILSGTPAAIAIDVYGEDLDQLRAVARRIEQALAGVPGARDVLANREILANSLPIRFRHADLAAAGLRPAEAAEQVRQALAGETVARIGDGSRRFDLVVRLAEDQRERIDQIGELLVRVPSAVHGGGSGMAGEGPEHSYVRLREIAEIVPEPASRLIAREGARRKATISCNVAEGSNLGDLVAAVMEVVDPIVREEGLSVRYGGQFEAQQSAARSIAILGAAVVGAVFLLLRIATGSSGAALLILLNLPLGLIGGIAAIYLVEVPSPWKNTLALIGGGEFIAPIVSIAGLVGFVTLFGIAVRNGLLLVGHCEALRRAGATPAEAAIRGATERLVPILMTALTAALGLVPLAMARGEPGSELLAPLAVVVLGGLLSSTALNLVVVPAGYAVLRRVDARDPLLRGAAR
ncbi:MAG TPA: efflux RND transporter permease subunit [Phycisphaerales bacterium]|nr:efflux RND transporter permease subunit [Phycisphaerales bacterium]HMP36194.1 efflux RND transporter permease subunit [Phycisphaerales bacterium]